ncbi:g2682 [Coccomyxa elongata]
MAGEWRPKRKAFAKFPESPLASLSTSLSSARRSADNLLHVAAEAERKLKAEGERIKAEFEKQAKTTGTKLRESLQHLQPPIAEDWPNVMAGIPAAGTKRDRSRSKMRRVRSASDFRRGSRMLTGSALGEEGKEWDLFAALNNTLSANRSAVAGSPYQAPSTFQDQARMVVSSDAARKLLAAPKRTIRTAKQTLENCQENLQSLGNLLQQTMAANLAVISRQPTQEPDLAKPVGSHNTNFATRKELLAPARPVNQMESVPLDDLINMEGPGGSPGSDLMRSWFSGFLRSREIAEIDRAIRGEAGDGANSPAEEPAPKSPFGPLQREAQRRRDEQRRRRSSSLREPGRRIAIYTTASLPWMTGTAVNPLLRAAYLAKEKHRDVTLVIPWLAPPDQRVVFNNLSFETPEQQEEYVRAWARKRTGLPCDFKVAFYPGRYAAEKCSILPVGDPTSYIPDSEADVAVLEEPEHLNWYHHGRRWTDKFQHVVGIIHTNYLDYAQREEGGALKAKALAVVNQIVCRMHCHKIVKLSDAVQEMPRSVTQFVHGVPGSFLAVGEAKAKPPPDGGPRFTKGAYFIGKAIWAKGYTELLDLMEKDSASREMHTHVDCYGYGDDLEELKAASARKKLPLQFHGARDHLDDSMHEYRVFVNPSTSDVVATTTAEALAMGKWVVVADLPCNAFFKRFSNCLTYRTQEEFSERLRTALAQEPHPMSSEERRRLTWEDATERFLDAAELKSGERPKPIEEACDRLAWKAFNAVSGVEPIRAISGAGINTRDNPGNLADFMPAIDGGGIFDNKTRARAAARAAQKAT